MNKKCSEMGGQIREGSEDTMHTLISGWPGINYAKIWRHEVIIQKIIGRIWEMEFENKFRKRWVVKKKPNYLLLEDQKSYIRGCKKIKCLGVKVDKEDRQ